MNLTEELTRILKLKLPRKYTAVSYAIQVDGQLWAADAVGTDGAPEAKNVTVSHTFNVCSISKVILTTAVMQLREKGLLDLDAPLVTYLPEFTMADPRYRQITLRHCLNHSSGLPGTQWKHFSSTRVGSMDNEEYYREVLAYLAPCRLKADPGACSAYCNDGFTLAEMAVARVSGEPFAEYCLKHITGPLGCSSTRTSLTRNEEFPLVREQGKAPELFYLQGCGGFTTTMTDLCRFGQLFLEEDSPVLSRASMEEMGKPQGATFLEEDTAAPSFGLGWDQVRFRDPDLDLGEHVLTKGGNSFQFTSRLFVIPRYRAVLAISETHDCHLDVGLEILRLFAAAMWRERGISLYSRSVPVPEETKAALGGVYLMPGQLVHPCFFGDSLTLTADSADGRLHRALWADLHHDGKGNFLAENGERFFFLPHGADIYLMHEYRSRVIPTAMRAPVFPPLPDSWTARDGKRYVCVSQSDRDMVSHEIMTGFTLRLTEELPGIAVLAFASAENAEVYFDFEATVVPVDDSCGRGFLTTPSNGSRDLVYPRFYEKDGAEYCDTASYTYRETGSLPDYAGQTFDSVPAGGPNGVYRITEPLPKLPEVPEGRRLTVLGEDLRPLWDSQMPGEYREVKAGWLCLI